MFTLLHAIRRAAEGSRLWIVALACAAAVGCGGGSDGGSGGSFAMLPPAVIEELPRSSQPPQPEKDRVEASAAAKPACSVMLEGDSILWGGFGGDKRLAEPPAAALKRLRPAYTVIDNAASGSTARQRAPVFAGTAVGTRFVVLAHGLNDGQFGFDLAPPLRQMVQHAKAAGATPIVTGLSRQPTVASRRDATDAVARQVAAETGALFADWDSVPYQPTEMADMLHPGPAYSVRLVERLVAILDTAAPECVG